MGYPSGERINVRNSCLLGSWVSSQRNSVWVLGGRFVSMHVVPRYSGDVKASFDRTQKKFEDLKKMVLKVEGGTEDDYKKVQWLGDVQKATLDGYQTLLEAPVNSARKTLAKLVQLHKQFCVKEGNEYYFHWYH